MTVALPGGETVRSRPRVSHHFGGRQRSIRGRFPCTGRLIEEGRRKGLEEGKAGEARRIILRQGRIRFGDAGDAVRSRLEAISDLEQLELLGDRLLIVSSWDQLLGQEEP